MNQKPVAIVTASSRGIGKACASQLSKNGYDLVLMSSSLSIQETADSIGAKAIQGSVTDERAIEQLVALAIEEYGRIDAVVNNTGHPPRGDLLEFSDRQWHDALDLLLMNVVRTSKLVTPHFLERGCGSIINISTLGAREPSLKFPISSALRGALSNFTNLYARRYAGNGLRMNNVLPGFVDSYPVDAETLATLPAERPATTDEIANVVTFLAGADSTYVNGQDIVVDGGLSYSA